MVKKDCIDIYVQSCRCHINLHKTLHWPYLNGQTELCNGDAECLLVHEVVHMLNIFFLEN